MPKRKVDEIINVQIMLYENLVRDQLKAVNVDIHSGQGAATEARFISDMTRFKTWIQFKSQYAAANAIFGSTDKKNRGYVMRSVDAGEWWRSRQTDKWIFRNMRRSSATSRGWHLLRRAVRIGNVLKILLQEQYAEGGHGRLRDLREFQQEFV
jgi:hypothetical protein